MANIRPLAGRVTENGRYMLFELRRRIGGWLKQQRVARGLTQRQLGELMGVGASAVSGWELGRIGLPEERCEALARTLGIEARLLATLWVRHENPWLFAELFGADADPHLQHDLSRLPDRVSSGLL